MGLLTHEVEVNCTTKNINNIKKYYTSPQFDQKYKMNIFDINHNNSYIVEVECNECGTRENLTLKSLYTTKRTNGLDNRYTYYICKECNKYKHSKYWSKQDEIIEMYVEFQNLEHLKDYFINKYKTHFTCNSLKNVLEANNVDICINPKPRNNGNYKGKEYIFTKEEIDKIIELRKKGKSLIKISNTVGLNSKEPIKKVLIEHGCYLTDKMKNFQLRDEYGIKIIQEWLQSDEAKEWYKMHNLQQLSLLDKDYKGVYEKMNFIDGNGYKYSINAHKLKQKIFNNKEGIYKFSKFNPYTKDNIVNLIKLSDNDDKTIEIYKDKHTYKVKFQCQYCDQEYIKTINQVSNGEMCPCIKQSQGELIILKYLKQNKISFKKEYKNNQCINPLTGYELKFDFAIYDTKQKDNLILLVEYDGEQHFQPVSFIKGEDKYRNFKSQQIRDQIKNQYCKDNNMPLLRIPYLEFGNIEQILEEWLNKYDLLHRNKINNLEMA